MGWLKNLLKRILPPPVASFMREIMGLRQLAVNLKQELSDQLRRQEELINAQQRQLETMANQLQEVMSFQQTLSRQLLELGQQVSEQKQQILLEQRQQLSEQKQQLSEQKQQLLALIEQTAGSISEKQDKAEQRILAEGKKQFDLVERTRRQAIDSSRYASESVWAAIFNNTITGSEWLHNKSFAPGRWAVGYPYLYVMYRVLNETKPKRILELGLGQSTKMIAQYCAANTGTEHYVVESNPDWIDFFKHNYEVPANSELVCMEYTMTQYKDAESVRIFEGFEKKFAGRKFDFISIDAPLGGDMKQYARIDVLNILPDCISENFVIMIDDCERSGETHTVSEMENKLKEAGIPYKTGRYCGKKDLVLITADHMGFLASM